MSSRELLDVLSTEINKANQGPPQRLSVSGLSHAPPQDLQLYF